MRENKGKGREKIKEKGRLPDTHDQIYIRIVQQQNEPDAPYSLVQRQEETRY